MTRGTYTAASGMLACMAAQEAIASNLANASTMGYKQDVPEFESFQNVLLDRMSGAAQAGGNVGSLGMGVAVKGVVPDYTQGALENTGNSLDVALVGNAYLAIQTPQGVHYTRDGALTRGVDGNLVEVGSLAPVLDTNGKTIPIPAAAKNITITPQGQISADGTAIAQMAIVGLNAGSGVQKVGNSELAAAKPTAPSADASVRQGYLETSNVNTVSEMVSMINAQRTYETNAKMLQVEDSTTGKAVETVAIVQ